MSQAGKTMSRKSAVKELTCNETETEARRRESSDSDYDEIEVQGIRHREEEWSSGKWRSLYLWRV